MCGIVGLYVKKRDLADQLGALFAEMLICMSDRGPDSAGLALYGNEPPEDFIKVTLRYAAFDYDWPGLADQLGARFGCEPSLRVNANYAVIAVRADADSLWRVIAGSDPGLTVMSIGRSIEILKEIGPPAEIVERFGVRKMRGTHVIGHTRMATESAVTTDGSHPFSTGMDLCLVHNGSLSNHNRLRVRLERSGIEIRTENDSTTGGGRLLDVADAAGRYLASGPTSGTRRSGRLLYLCHWHGRWLRGLARPDCLQAGRAGRDGRVRGDGQRVPGVGPPARDRCRRDLGA